MVQCKTLHELVNRAIGRPKCLNRILGRGQKNQVLVWWKREVILAMQTQVDELWELMLVVYQLRRIRKLHHTDYGDF